MIMEGFKEVSKEEYFDYVMSKDSVYSVQGDSKNYLGIFTDRRGNVLGKEVPDGVHYGTTDDKFKYYIKL